MDDLKFFTPSELAELLKISYDKSIELIKYGGLPHNKIGHQYRVSQKDLIKFLADNKKANSNEMFK